MITGLDGRPCRPWEAEDQAIANVDARRLLMRCAMAAATRALRVRLSGWPMRWTGAREKGVVWH